jgi:hypothetical protein
MGHEHLASALVELRQILTTAPGSYDLFHPPPDACNGMEMVSAVSREDMQRDLPLLRLQGGGPCAGAVATTAIDDHDHLCGGRAQEAHHLMHRLTACVGIKVGDDFREDAGGAVRHRPNDIEQDAAGDPAPPAVLLPRLAFETLLGVEWALGERADGQAVALRPSPPPASGQGKAPQPRLIVVEQNELPLTRPLFQGGPFKVAIGQVCRVGIEPTGGAAGA